jgi:hypothetical protein
MNIISDKPKLSDEDLEIPLEKGMDKKKVPIFKIEPDKKESRLMDLLKDNLSCEMYHALLDVFDSKHYVIKIHLTVFLLISYGLASYMTIELIMNYFNYGVTTSIRTIYETPSLFPKVTFCNLNQYVTKEAYEFLRSTDTDGLFSSLANLSFYDRTQTIWKIILKAGGILMNKTDDFKKSMGHDLKDILIGCAFNYAPCSVDDFLWSYDSYYGNCYSFNSGFNSTGQPQPFKYSTLPGYSYGLELDLYVNYNENLDFLNSILGGKGALIRVDNITHVVKHTFDGISVSPGISTKIALKREFKSILPQPYSDCVMDQGKYNYFDTSDLFNKIKSSPYDYTQSFCLQQCMQQFLIEQCTCGFTPFWTKEIFPNLCNDFNQTACTIRVYLSDYIPNDYSTKYCLPKCPKECNSTQITATTTSYELLGNGYFDYIQKNANLSSDFISKSITNETVQKSMVRVFVNYDSLSYTQSEEAPQIDIISLIANIGGNLGLFLGVSLFSVWEIVITLLEIYFYKKQQKVNVKPSNEKLFI